MSNLDVILEDNETINKFNELKFGLIERNRFRVVEFNYSEYITINGINNIMIIKLYEEEPCFLGCA